MADDDAIELDPFTEIVDFNLGAPLIFVTAEIVPPNNTVGTSGSLSLAMDGATLEDEVQDFQPGGMDQLDRLVLSNTYELIGSPTVGNPKSGVATCVPGAANTVVSLNISSGLGPLYEFQDLVYTGPVLGGSTLTLSFNLVRLPDPP